MKNAVFWDVEPCGSCVNRRFGGTYRLHLQGRKIRERGTSVSRWQQTQALHGATSQKTAFFIFHQLHWMDLFGLQQLDYLFKLKIFSFIIQPINKRVQHLLWFWHMWNIQDILEMWIVRHSRSNELENIPSTETLSSGTNEMVPRNRT
jgi:hypothetical protein